MSRQEIIRCDHCNKDITQHEGTNKIKHIHVQVYTKGVFRGITTELDHTLDLCTDCGTELREYIMDWIQPKHYKY